MKGVPMDLSLDTLTSAVRTGRAIGNALVPRGSRRARSLGAVANRIQKAITGGSKKRSGSAPGRRPPKRRRKLRKRRINVQYQGKMGPKLPKSANKITTSKFQRQGYVIEFESGGSITDSQAVYVAHGFPAQVVLEAMCCSIARKALYKFGLVIKGWNIGGMTGSITDNFQWTIQYREGPQSQVVNHTSALTIGTQTALLLGQSLADLFCFYITGSTTFFEVVEIRLVWRKTTGTPPVDDWREEYRVMAQSLNFDMSFKSNMTVQNRTNSVGGGSDESSVLDVAHNPLKGKMYFGQATAVNMKSADNGANNAFISLDKATGFGSAAASGALTTVGTKKVPMWSDLTHIYGSTPVLLKAGEIRSSWINFNERYTFARLFKKLLVFMSTAQTAAATTNIVDITFPIRVLGLEKVIDSRTAGQPDVALAYQTNYLLGMMCSTSKRDTPLRLIAGI